MNLQIASNFLAYKGFFCKISEGAKTFMGQISAVFTKSAQNGYSLEAKI